MQTLIDTHAHLYSSKFDSDRPEMIRRAIAAGVTRMHLPNIDSESIDAMLALEAAFPDNCFAMMGLHPSHVKPETFPFLRLFFVSATFAPYRYNRYMPVEHQTVRIFIAYSHKDRAFLDELRVHAAPLTRNQRLQIWFDGEIRPGEVWDSSI